MKIVIDDTSFVVYTDNSNEIGGHNMTSDAAKAASAKYDAVNTIQLKMKLNKKTDADILEKLNAVANKQGYIKALIRSDISAEVKA